MIGGCGGSFPTPSGNFSTFSQTVPSTSVRVPFERDIYGSLTASYMVWHEETIIVVDSGQGIKNISRYILGRLKATGQEKATVHMLFTHLHGDHVEGMNMNKLFFKKGITLRLYSPELARFRGEKLDPSGTSMIREMVAKYFPETAAKAIYFPVTQQFLAQHGAAIEYTPMFLPGSTLTIGGLPIRTMALAHPGGSVGYRIEVPGNPVVIVTDHEMSDSYDSELFAFTEGAWVFCVDMQYRQKEYDGAVPLDGVLAEDEDPMPRKDWGHGTDKNVVNMLARCQKAPRIVRAVHHDPARSDMDLVRFKEETAHAIQLKYKPKKVPYSFDFGHDGEVHWIK